MLLLYIYILVRVALLKIQFTNFTREIILHAENVKFNFSVISCFVVVDRLVGWPKEEGRSSDEMTILTNVQNVL